MAKLLLNSYVFTLRVENCGSVQYWQRGLNFKYYRTWTRCSCEPLSILLPTPLVLTSILINSYLVSGKQAWVTLPINVVFFFLHDPSFKHHVNFNLLLLFYPSDSVFIYIYIREYYKILLNLNKYKIHTDTHKVWNSFSFNKYTCISGHNVNCNDIQALLLQSNSMYFPV